MPHTLLAATAYAEYLFPKHRVIATYSGENLGEAVKLFSNEFIESSSQFTYLLNRSYWRSKLNKAIWKAKVGKPALVISNLEIGHIWIHKITNTAYYIVSVF